MSITRELKNSQSKASKWLAANFELDALSVLLGAQVDATDAIRPTGFLKDYPWSVVGHAVEFRLRQMRDTPYFATTASVAPVSSSANITRLFHDALGLLWDEHQSETCTSRENAWVMYFAGIAEGIYRSGRTEDFASAERVLRELAHSATWQAVMAEMESLRRGRIAGVDPKNHPCLHTLPLLLPVSDDVLDDIARTSDAAIANDAWSQITDGNFIDNPAFAGAVWVGGADGDFIVDRTLFDVKCTIHPEKLWLGALRQMIAYVALDSHDQFEIDALAVFLPRQHGAVARAGLDEILAYSTFSTRQDMQRSLRAVLHPARA
ncbi:MAG: hypothetical protein ACYCU8_06040 [Ferrimicrobium acidiphilum]